MIKTLLLTTAAGALLLTGVIASDTNAQDQESKEDSSHDSQNISSNIKQLAEYDVLDGQVGMEDYQAQIVTDNIHKRVIVLLDENNRQQFKSIFIKNTNRHKIIDFGKGQIFNQIIKNSEGPVVDTNNDENSNVDSDNVEGFVEFEILEDEIDVDDDYTQIVEDNQHKRIMLVGDEDNHKQFKSIYIKDTSRLKIIDFNNGLVFNQIIK